MATLEELTLKELSRQLKLVGLNAVDILNRELFNRKEELMWWADYEKQILAAEYQTLRS